jgi:hypothetical protein
MLAASLYLAGVREGIRGWLRCSGETRWPAFAALLLACSEESELPKDASARDAAASDDAAAESSDAAGDAADPDAAHVFEADCDPEDPQREDGFYERFADGIDSNCDGRDDPAMVSAPCSCDWLESAGMPEVSRCGAGFDPAAAQLAVSSATLGVASCAMLPDLAISFVAQCKSECAGVPIYFSVANLGGARSAPATVSLDGSFRSGPSRTPLAIEPLEPGQHTALIDVLATGAYRIVVATSGEQCSTDNDAVSVDAYDLHCGFF